MEIILEFAGKRSPSNQLSAIRLRMAEVAEEGKWLAEIEEHLKTSAINLVRAGYLRHESPDGAHWRPGKSGGGDLIMSGAMFAALKVEDLANGFAITDRVATSGGVYYGGSHQYGRTIKAKGFHALQRAVKFNGTVRERYSRYRKGTIKAGWGVSPSGGPRRLKMAAYRESDGKYHYVRESESRPLTWRTPDGQWHSAYKIRIPARPIVPASGRLPDAWRRRFESACDYIMRKVLGVGPSY